MTRDEFIYKLNAWGASRTPFLFIVDFEFKKPLAMPLNDADPAHIKFFINGVTNDTGYAGGNVPASITEKRPIDFDSYKVPFSKVYHHLQLGNSYLTNLTCRTSVKLSAPLMDIFHYSHAKYKLWIRDQFVVFSPECFVRIKGDRIFSYPMKGTIDASVANAAQVVLHDKKELAEHVTIVDLIRNDLSQVASRVEVPRFRYIDELRTNEKNLLQVSSEVTGVLPQGFHASIGTVLAALLPAGSVSGAPKAETLQIIAEAEKIPRGYYTGVFGYFNGQELDSGVMIRFIEQNGGHYYYRSGGGITIQSEPEKEYQEMIDKVYVPVN
jgi:para-aminobenzoate synthetase component I